MNRAAVATLFVLLALSALLPRPASAQGAITGELPPAGGLALVVWSGGSAEELGAAATALGCRPLSIWTNRSGGGLIGYIVGAPQQVNAGFMAEYPAAMLPSTPVILRCVAVAPGVPSQPPPGSTPFVPPPGPPGPAGNYPL